MKCVVDACVQAVPSSPLFAGASAAKQADDLSHAQSSTAADVAATSSSSREHATTHDTSVVEPVPQPPKPYDKQTVPVKPAHSSLFADDNDADDLFASPAPVKVGTGCSSSLAHCCYDDVDHYTVV